MEKKKPQRGEKDEEEERGKAREAKNARKVYRPLWTRPLLDSYKWVLFPMKHTATVYSFP